jgi:ADP-heptose:LPS heptosyltransferase
MGGITDYVAWPPHIKLIESRYSFLFSAIYKFTYGDENESSCSTESIITQYCRQHDISVTDVHPRLHITSASFSRVNELLESHQVGRSSPLVVIHPGPSWHVKEWPMKSWSQLVEELTGRGIETIIQLGSGKRGERGVALDVEIPGVLSLVNHLTIEESFALISICKVFIGIDSGLLHGAACFGVPAIGVFGPTLPRLLYSAAEAVSFVTSKANCLGCHHRVPRLHWQTGCTFDIQCMKSIPVRTVLERCLALMGPTMNAGGNADSRCISQC